MSALPPSKPIDPAVIRQAALWLVRLHSGEAGSDDHAACLRWRQSCPAHEQAWRKAERLSHQFGSLPSELGVPVLTRRGGMDRRAAIKTLLLFGAAVPAWLGYRYAPRPDWMADYHTVTGEHRDITLVDGTRLSMNTGTAIDVLYSETTRLVTLRHGEIYIETAPDRSGRERPFIVETPQSRLRALGTRFVVRALDGDESTTLLSVLEHRVEISPRSDGPPLIAREGQRFRITGHAIAPQGSGPRINEAQRHDPPNWTRGALHADDMRLADFLHELARYRPGIIRCEPEVADLRISGVFQLADTDYVLAVVRDTLPVQIVQHTKYWVTVAPGKMQRQP